MAESRTSRTFTAAPPRSFSRSTRVSWPLGVAHDGHPASVRAHDLPLGDRLRRVVRALAVHVGAQGEEQARDVVLARTPPRGPRRAAPRPGARGRPSGRTGRPAPLSRRTEASPFTPTTRTSASAPRPLQVPHVPDVQDVEAAVGEGDRPARARAPRPRGPPPRSSVPTFSAARLTTPRGAPGAGSAPPPAAAPAWETVAVPRFITTSPPA